MKRDAAATLLVWYRLLCLLSAAVTVQCSGGPEACPDRCVCSDQVEQVSCEGAGLTNLPRDIRSSVTTLDMRRNDLTELRSGSLATLGRVVRLTMSSNRLRSVADGAFEDARHLQMLDLGSNNLTELTAGTFRGTTMLLHLDASFNRLERIDGAFGGMAVLSRLDLSGNRLRKITRNTFRGLTNLRYLLLADNRIESIDRDAFVDLDRMMHLVLKGNPIRQTAWFRFSSQQLSYLDVSECELADIPRGLPVTLRYLQLRRNNITALHRDSFSDSPELSILVLDENLISSVEKDTFTSLYRLQQLWLNFNRLANVPHTPVQLQRLLLESNQVGELTADMFPDQSRIETLSLSGNAIRRVDPKALLRLRDLQNLDLSNNQIRCVESRTFVENKNLKSLQLSRNPLENLKAGCFQSLASLRQMSLAFVSTPTVTVNDDIFSGVEALSKLDLDSSPGLIRAMMASDDLLSSLASLRELSLRNSHLQTLRADFPEFFPNLAVLRLSSSRWHCDRTLVWFKTWFSVTPVEVLDSADANRCHSPPSIRNRSIVTLPDDEFVPIQHPNHDDATDDFSGVTDDLPANGQPVKFPEARQLDSFPEVSGESNSVDVNDERSFAENNWSIGGADRARPDPEVTSKTTSTIDKGTRPEVISSGMAMTAQGEGPVDSLPVPVDSSRNPLNEGNPPFFSSPSSSSTSSSSQNVIIASVTVCLVIIVVVVSIVVAVVVLGDLKRRRNGVDRVASMATSDMETVAIPDIGLPLSSGERDAKQVGDCDAASYHRSSPPAAVPPPVTPMTLVPGRDFNHEGPHRVYKWTDF